MKAKQNNFSQILRSSLEGNRTPIRIVPHKGKDGLTGFVIGDTLIQNAAIVLELNQGELKEDPVLKSN